MRIPIWSLMLAGLFLSSMATPARGSEEDYDRHGGREDNDRGIRAQIAAVQAQMTALQSIVSALQTANNGLKNELNNLQTSCITMFLIYSRSSERIFEVYRSKKRKGKLAALFTKAELLALAG